MAGEKPRDGLINALTNRELYGHADIENAYARVLGELTINFSLLNYLFERMSWKIWELHPKTGEILTKDLRISHLVEKLIASANHRISAEYRDEFKKLLSRAKKIAEKRNDLLHSLWLIKDGEPVLCVSRKHGVRENKDISVEQIAKFNADIIRLTNEFIAFQKKEESLGLGLTKNLFIHK